MGDRKTELLARSGLILEALAASVTWELAPSILSEIRAILPGIREAIAQRNIDPDLLEIMQAKRFKAKP